MTKARQASATATFVDEYSQRYQDLFPEVCSFEAFKHLLVLQLDMVDKSTRPLQTHFGPVFG